MIINLSTAARKHKSQRRTCSRLRVSTRSTPVTSAAEVVRHVPRINYLYDTRAPRTKMCKGPVLLISPMAAFPRRQQLTGRRRRRPVENSVRQAVDASAGSRFDFGVSSSGEGKEEIRGEGISARPMQRRRLEDYTHVSAEEHKRIRREAERARERKLVSPLRF